MVGALRDFDTIEITSFERGYSALEELVVLKEPKLSFCLLLRRDLQISLDDPVVPGNPRF